jgi:hypothetical protein
MFERVHRPGYNISATSEQSLGLRARDRAIAHFTHMSIAVVS